MQDLSDPTQLPIRFVPSPTQFTALMQRLGISNSPTVVVYDTEGGLWCARLWWALRYYGHQKVKLLEGGLTKWQRELRPLEKTTTSPTPATFEAQVHPELRATFLEVQEAIGQRDVQVLDALPESHHTGQTPSMPGLPAGHIPSANNVPAPSNLDPRTSTLLEPHKLAMLYRQAGIRPANRVIPYCGGGYWGAFSLFVLYQLGYENLSLYDGSWVEWASRGGPIETGP